MNHRSLSLSPSHYSCERSCQGYDQSQGRAISDHTVWECANEFPVEFWWDLVSKNVTKRWIDSWTN